MDFKEAMEKGVPRFFFHINIETHAYIIKETGCQHSADCKNTYDLINNHLGIEAGFFGGDHRLNRVFDRFKEESGFSGTLNDLIEQYGAKNLDFLVKEYGAENLAVIYTERKLNEEEIRRVKKSVPDFFYVGSLKFGKNTLIAYFKPI